MGSTRFSDRVDEYARYRPRYAPAIVDVLQAAGVLPLEGKVADLGAGTGLLSEVFLNHGYAVCGVEPDANMLRRADRELAKYGPFLPIHGSAEATTLPDAAVDFVAAGQAFHWFNPGRTRVECQRVLRQGGGAALIWNERCPGGNAFAGAYERLLEHFGQDYQGARLGRVVQQRGGVDVFFDGCYTAETISGRFVLDYERLKGFLLSCSYAPLLNHPAHESMFARLDELFAEYERRGQVIFPMETRIYYGYL
jgi:SAM-dependent methyltransferase